MVLQSDELFPTCPLGLGKQPPAPDRSRPPPASAAESLPGRGPPPASSPVPIGPASASAAPADSGAPQRRRGLGFREKMSAEIPSHVAPRVSHGRLEEGKSNQEVTKGAKLSHFRHTAKEVASNGAPLSTRHFRSLTPCPPDAPAVAYPSPPTPVPPPQFPHLSLHPTSLPTPIPAPGGLLGGDKSVCWLSFILLLRTFVSGHFILGENTPLLPYTVS